MKSEKFSEIIERSKNIRDLYHELEKQLPEGKWSLSEDALGFLTDAGVVGRQTMAKQGRWPAKNTDALLTHKLGECIWWLIVLADRMDIDIEEAVNTFLEKTEAEFK